MAWFQSLDPELESAKNAVLADNWWVVALRGVLAILFGIVAFVAPVATMLALVLFFAAYCLIDGILGVVLAVRGARKGERWGWFLLNGLLGIAIGVMAALWPGITVLAFVFMIAAWALLSGGLMLGAAIAVGACSPRCSRSLKARTIRITPKTSACAPTHQVSTRAPISGLANRSRP